MGEGVFPDVEQFEQRLELPKGFYTDLLREDDWSFVIKLSAFLEAACTTSLWCGWRLQSLRMRLLISIKATLRSVASHN
jgi:hypothetical protein